MKKHSVFIGFFGLSIAIFLWKLIVMRGGFISGDYSVQFYPWSMLYAESIKNLGFPYWIRSVQSGFPLMAEGQVGGFYPLHIIFYFLLPFRVAYNYVVVMHFIIAGVFTYLYSFKMGACRWGGTLAAILFCFGSAYAGCLVNTATLKTMAWFPLILLLIELYFDRKKTLFVIGSGIILGMQLLAGASQVGLYVVMMASIYYVTGLIVRKMLSVKALMLGVTMPVLALLVFLPQLLLTRTMSSLSWRSAADLDFALTLSLSPLNFISAVFPRTVFHGPGVYIGLLSLLFLISALLVSGKKSKLYPIFAVLFMGIFTSLGRYNPLFVFILKMMEFYDFRGPSKVIVFSLFSASVLAGIGFSVFFSDERVRQRALKGFSMFLSLSLAIFFVARGFLILFKDNILAFGQEMIKKYVYGKPFHRYDLERYMEKVIGFYDTMAKRSSLEDPFIMLSVIFCVFLIFMAVCIYRGKIRLGDVIRPVFLSIILADLLIFSMYSPALGGNIEDFRAIEPEYPGILNHMRADKGLFRVLPHDIASRKLPGWLDPSLNAIYGIDSVALYTPLASEYYRKETDALEVIDNALGFKSSREDALRESIDLVRLLNVKYVVSPRREEEPFLDYVMSERGVFLYEIKNFLPRAFVSRDLSLKGIDTAIPVKIIHYFSGHAVFEVNMPHAGFLVFSENRYPGWNVTVNGKTSEIEPFSVIQAVRLEKGSYTVEFSYDPWASVKFKT
jgi:hypothetical protein